jgi:hypothetical protein
VLPHTVHEHAERGVGVPVVDRVREHANTHRHVLGQALVHLAGADVVREHAVASQEVLSVDEALCCRNAGPVQGAAVVENVWTEALCHVRHTG